MKKIVYNMAIWNLLRPLSIFYGHLEIKWSFGIFSPVLVYCVKKALATLQLMQSRNRGKSNPKNVG
jgi:hypothetical protein